MHYNTYNAVVAVDELAVFMACFSKLACPVILVPTLDATMLNKRLVANIAACSTVEHICCRRRSSSCPRSALWLSTY